MNLKTIERGEVKKDSPTPGETWINDVAIIYNRWIRSKAEIRTIAWDMNPLLIIIIVRII